MAVIAEMRSNRILFLFKDPITLYLSWLVIFCIFCLIIVPILSLGSSGGEQKPMILLSYAIDVAIWGFFIISLISPFFFSTWIKKYWYVNLIIASITGYILASVHLSDNKQVYDFAKEEINKGNHILTIEREYYINTKILRSERFFLDGHKDSVWSVYDLNGKLLERLTYKNDKLLSSGK